MTYRELLDLILGRDSGWRVTSHPTKLWNLAIPDFAGFNAIEMGLENNHGMPYKCNLTRAEAGIPFIFETTGSDQVRRLLPSLLNKVLTGPIGRGGVNESDIRGLFGSLSLGISTEETENVTLVWFGDWATGISLLTAFAPQLSITAQIALSTAVAIVPSGGSGAHFHKGVATLNT